MEEQHDKEQRPQNRCEKPAWKRVRWWFDVESKRVPTVMSLEQCILVGGTAMPLPHYPSDEPDEEHAPDLNDVVDRILNRGDDPSPTPTGV